MLTSMPCNRSHDAMDGHMASHDGHQHALIPECGAVVGLC